MTSRKFPKVNLSTQQQAKILAKISKHGQINNKFGTTTTTESLESKSRFAMNATLSPIPLAPNEQIYSKNKTSSIFMALNRLEKLGQTEKLTTKESVDEEYNHHYH